MQSQSDLQRAIRAVQVRFGEQALVQAGRLAAAAAWPCGLGVVDRLSGIGGLPRGRVCVLAGGPGSGKLSLGLALLAQATRDFAQAVVIDAAAGFDPWGLAALGGDLEPLTVVRPPGSEAAGEAAVTLARAGAGFLLVVGAGRLPEAALAPLESAAARSGCLVVAVAETPPAALAYASSLTLELARASWTRERGELVGLRARVLCVKNKVAAPGGTGELEVRYPLGPLLPRAEVREAVVDEEEAEAWRSAAG